MIWLGILIGLALGIGGTLLFNYLQTKEKDKKRFIRRGIWSNGYTSGNESFSVQFELGELEATSKRSKVKVISMVASQSRYNNMSTKLKLKEMVDLTWMNSDDIEWIEEDVAKKRNDRIDEILK
jgi:hypothetical protein